MRTLAEIFASLAYLLLHVYPIGLVYYLGASLRAVEPYSWLYYGLIATGYLAGWAALIHGLRRGLGKLPDRQGKRLLFDQWLAAFFVALPVAGALVYFNLPIRLRGWDAHGFGAMGGEANAILLPWLQLASWWFFAKKKPDVSR